MTHKGIRSVSRRDCCATVLMGDHHFVFAIFGGATAEGLVINGIEYGKNLE